MYMELHCLSCQDPWPGAEDTAGSPLHYQAADTGRREGRQDRQGKGRPGQVTECLMFLAVVVFVCWLVA